MANSMELITKYSTKAWDKVYKAESCSSVLDGEKDLLKFTGVKTVKIAKFSSSGLSDYRRANAQVPGNFAGNSTSNYSAANSGVIGYGYQQGDAALVWEEFTINCDRAAQFRIELFDDEETDGLAVAATTTEVSRTKVIPEVDAYCFSKIAEYAGTVDTTSIVLSSTIGMGSTNGPIAALNDAFLKLAEYEVPEAEQVIFCSPTFYNYLRKTNELVRKLSQTEYGQDIKFTIGEYEGREIIQVPQSRFKTLIDLKQGGYGWKSGTQNIDFIVCAKSAIYHVTKYDKVKVFAPGVVQDFDGYKVNIRVYHDVFVPDNKRLAIYVHTSAPSVAAVNNLNVVYNSTLNAITSVSLYPGDALVDGIYISATGGVTVGATLVSVADAIKVTPYKPFPATATAGTYQTFAVYNGSVIATGNSIVVS